MPASWGSNRHLFGEIVSIPARLHIGSISAANVLAKIHVGYWISRRAAGLGTCLEDFQASKQAWVYLAQLSLNQSCSTFSAVVALVFYPRKGCLCFGSMMPRRFYSDIREQHQDLVSQWPWLPDAFTLHGLVPSNPWRMLDIFFQQRTSAFKSPQQLSVGINRHILR